MFLILDLFSIFMLQGAGRRSSPMVQSAPPRSQQVYLNFNYVFKSKLKFHYDINYSTFFVAGCWSGHDRHDGWEDTINWAAGIHCCKLLKLYICIFFFNYVLSIGYCFHNINVFRDSIAFIAVMFSIIFL